MFTVKAVQLPLSEMFSLQIVDHKTGEIEYSRLVHRSHLGEYVQYAVDNGTLEGLKNQKESDFKK